VLEEAFSLYGKGQLAEAASVCRKVLAENPKSADALHLLGVIESQRNNSTAGIALLDRAAELQPANAQLFFNRGIVLRDLKRLEDAVASYDRALAIKPDFVEALQNRGGTLQELRRLDDALVSYDRALAVKPDHAEALNNRGAVLKALGRLEDALASYDRSLALKPDNAIALSNRGNLLRELKQFDGALESYDRALAVRPDHVEALHNRANALLELSRFDQALEDYDRARAIKPGDAFLLGDRLYCKMIVCKWTGIADDFDEIVAGIEAGRTAATPFTVQAAPLSAALQRRCAEIYVRERCPVRSDLPALGHAYRHDKIRLGYFSSDFRKHAVASLVAELFERHDRSRFELVGFAFGPPTQDPMRMRLEKAFDKFFDCGALSDKDVAQLARRLEIDIAVDLNGFTRGSRTDVFAMRAAPIQVNFLGYPGTMGSVYIDYLIADATLIPPDHRRHYAERIVILPDTYQPNDPMRAIAESPFRRAECGLPELGFAFCCFNNSYKFTPQIFALWMRLLTKVDGSVLWLLQDNESAAKHLRAEAHARGVRPERLVFASRMDQPEHLARQRLADLFLDTSPYNAHTTASDALWAGLPVLTCLGQTFAGRVAASLLNAVGLPELITHSLDAYEALALELVADRQRLHSLRGKLAANRTTYPLFDTARFARHIESAYAAMWGRHQAGLAPDDIDLRHLGTSK